jgi:D-Tyr-tRNAtyr deacylase
MFMLSCIVCDLATGLSCATEVLPTFCCINNFQTNSETETGQRPNSTEEAKAEKNRKLFFHLSSLFKTLVHSSKFFIIR